MRAATLDSPSGTVHLADLDRPAGNPATVLSAALNPVDLAIAQGKIPFRQLPSNAVLGFEGIARTGSGETVYFSAPTPPSGSFAELVDLAGAETVAVPEGLEPEKAAAVGVPGIAAWLALIKAGLFRPDDRVLVLGGTGSVGRIAIQTALALGAASITGTARNQAGVDDIEGLGAQAVDTTELATSSEALAKTSADGFDVVIDTLWGDVAALALEHIRPGGRLVQVGNVASPTATITAPTFRNRGITITGHSNFLDTPEDRANAFAKIIELTRQGSVAVSPTTISLEGLPGAWADLESGRNRGKIVVLP